MAVNLLKPKIQEMLNDMLLTPSKWRELILEPSHLSFRSFRERTCVGTLLRFLSDKTEIEILLQNNYIVKYFARVCFTCKEDSA